MVVKTEAENLSEMPFEVLVPEPEPPPPLEIVAPSLMSQSEVLILTPDPELETIILEDVIIPLLNACPEAEISELEEESSMPLEGNQSFEK